MTLNGFLDWMDAVRPSPWSHEQKAVWVNDLESALWSQMLLAPSGLWRAKTAAADGERPLLLPDAWRRLYAAYVGAMMDFAAGENAAYANSMALYNGCLAELGAWYGETFSPAAVPPRWQTAAVITGESLGESGLWGCVLPVGSAVLAAELRILEAFGDGVTVSVGTAEEEDAFLSPAEIGQDRPGTYRRLAMRPVTEPGEVLLRAGGEVIAGRAELRLLVQPGAGCLPETTAARLAPVTVSVAAAAGAAGKSAYEIAVMHGFEGTEEAWLSSLRGEAGAPGPKGDTGDTGPQGPAGAAADLTWELVGSWAHGGSLSANFLAYDELLFICDFKNTGYANTGGSVVVPRVAVQATVGNGDGGYGYFGAAADISAECEFKVKLSTATAASHKVNHAGTASTSYRIYCYGR